MDQAILDLVKSLPNVWKVFEFDTLSSAQQEALLVNEWQNARSDDQCCYHARDKNQGRLVQIPQGTAWIVHISEIAPQLRAF
jgi:hypothetical protein